jgi:tRNA nucleotidyltransferase (CCA-adding enzyme)
MIKHIAKIIKDVGGCAYYVGGYVRDSILGIANKDIDIEVYGLELDELKSILSVFGNVKDVGKSFGVLKLDNFDFSIPRSEKKCGTGYTGFEITLDPYSTHVEACQRRDITINSIMKDVLTGAIIDPYNGVNDLKRGIIRHVNVDTFADDPLRVLRVAQFASRFNFYVTIDTLNLCKKLVHELKTLSNERIYIELEKMLMKSDKPSIAFEHLLFIGVIEELFPELYDLVGLDQGKLYHPEGDCWNHVMLALDYIPKEERTMTLMLAIILHDLGKISTGVRDEERNHVHFHGHNKASVPLAEKVLSRITNETKLIKEVLELIECHMMPYLCFKDGVKRKTVRRLALKCNVPLLMKLHLADKCSRGTDLDTSYVDEILDMYDDIQNEIKPLVKGRHLIEHLNMTPGKHFGKILKEIFEVQLDGIITTVEEGIQWVKDNVKTCYMQHPVFDAKICEFCSASKISYPECYHVKLIEEKV